MITFENSKNLVDTDKKILYWVIYDYTEILQTINKRLDCEKRYYINHNSC